MEATKYMGSTRWPDLVVNKVAFTEPLTWLLKGWDDMLAAKWYSLRYATAIVFISALLTLGLIISDKPFLLTFLLSGFFLVAPIVAIGLYQMSAHLEKNEPLKSCSALEALKQNHTQISMISAGFFIIIQLWIAVNFVLFALLYNGISPPLDHFFSKIFLSEEGRVFLFASIFVGFFFAACAFAISVVTVPMLLDRKVDGFTAIRFSIKSVLENLPAMMLWAFIIVLVVGFGLLTFYIGLIIALPIIGHGTWHAYRALIPSTE